MKTLQQNCASVERAHPGYIAMVGPFAVNHTKPDFAKAYKAECVRAHREQKKVCPKARIVMHGTQAWVIRKKPLELDNETRTRRLFSGDLGIWAGRMMKA
jgi:hypothetical protein